MFVTVKVLQLTKFMDEHVALQFLTLEDALTNIVNQDYINEQNISWWWSDLMAFHVFFLNQSSKSDAEAMGE